MCLNLILFLTLLKPKYCTEQRSAWACGSHMNYILVSTHNYLCPEDVSGISLWPRAPVLSFVDTCCKSSKRWLLELKFFLKLNFTWIRFSNLQCIKLLWREWWSGQLWCIGNRKWGINRASGILGCQVLLLASKCNILKKKERKLFSI